MSQQQRNSREHSNKFLRMNSIPSSFVIPQILDMDKTRADVESTGDWMSVLDRALSAVGTTTTNKSYDDCCDKNIFHPSPFVDDIPITLNDVPISVDDIDNVFDD